MAPCHSSRYASWVAVWSTTEAGHYWRLQMLKSRGLGAQGGGVRGTDVFTWHKGQLVSFPVECTFLEGEGFCVLYHPEPSLVHRWSSVNICQMSDSQMSSWASPSNEVVASRWNPVENKSGVRLGACPKVICCPITPWYSFIHLFIHSWNIYLFCNILSNSHWGTKMNVNQYCLIPSLSGAPGIPWWLRLGPHPWEETPTVQTRDGKHLTPPGNRGAGKSFSEVGTRGLHLDGRVGICEAGARPGGVLKVWRSGISQRQAEATLQPYFLTPSFLTTQTHWQYLFFLLTPSSFTPSQAHPRAWLHSKCTAQMQLLVVQQ